MLGSLNINVEKKNLLIDDPERATKDIIGHSFMISKYKVKRNRIIEWLGKDLKDHMCPTLLSWAGTSSTRPNCSESHPTWS